MALLLPQPVVPPATKKSYKFASSLHGRFYNDESMAKASAAVLSKGRDEDRKATMARQQAEIERDSVQMDEIRQPRERV